MNVGELKEAIEEYEDHVEVYISGSDEPLEDIEEDVDLWQDDDDNFDPFLQQTITKIILS